MPKVIGTRKQKAEELLKMLTEGPSFSKPFPFEGEFTIEEATRQFKLWSESWIIPVVKELVPELRKKEVKKNA